MSGTSRRSFESRIAGSGAPSWRPGQKWRSWASAAAWNVRAMTPRWPSDVIRSTISPAALSVKVTSRIWSGGTAPVSMAYAARRLMTRVLPEPAPAMIASGPEVAVTASRCDGLRSSSRRSAESAAVNDPTSRRASLQRREARIGAYQPAIRPGLPPAWLRSTAANRQRRAPASRPGRMTAGVRSRSPSRRCPGRDLREVRRAAASDGRALANQVDVGESGDRAPVRSSYRHRTASLLWLRCRPLTAALPCAIGPNLNRATFRLSEPGV